MNEITRIQYVFKKDHYHKAFRKQLLWTLLRINVNRLLCKKSTAIQNVMGFKMAPLNLKNLCQLFDEIFICGIYVTDLGKEKPEIIDCGANIGMSILFFKTLSPQCRITAFEPDPETFNVLSKTIALNNLDDVSAHNVAVSNENGETSFYKDPNVPGSLLMSIMDGPYKLAKAQAVRTVKLSEYINREIDLLKLDVEGAEHMVLRDLDDSQKIKFIKKMIIEYHPDIGSQGSKLSPFLEILERNGFAYHLQSNLPNIMIYAYAK